MRSDRPRLVLKRTAKTNHACLATARNYQLESPLNSNEIFCTKLRVF